ncbi:hypothetical protein L1987_76370 [Smallanthus sonchifolius]|uniref:Uncharacterized protein n=1 Tax=Smallanthus sonchifolius TaxID=185202 RepID=A0ACB9A809_9ASTR|nr:hypothetical protein L1987_76370 [Smallanthus sonchifolius]
MMALVNHQVQGSYAAPRPLALKKGIESKNISVTFPVVKHTYIILLKQRSCLCRVSVYLLGNSVKVPLSKRKSLKISTFKGNVQNDESGEKVSKSTENPVKLSYVPNDCNETLAESPKVKNNHATPSSNMDETAAGCLTIQQRFRSWLTLLRAPSQSQIPDGTLEE